MKSTFHGWVLNVMTGPKPTQYTKLANIRSKTKHEIGPKCIDCLEFRYLLFSSESFSDEPGAGFA